MDEKRKNVLEMDSKEAKNFFLKNESYFNAKLPDYITFDEAIKSAGEILKAKNGQPKDIKHIANYKTYGERDDLNYTIVMNKDGDYSWRPLVLIHPILYVDLVNYITNEDNWEQLVNRFEQFQNNNKINCYSIPVEASDKSKKTDTGETILNWWENFEQESIAKNIKFQYAMFTDIADCYPSIYTHSITWAMYGKKQVKQHKDKCRGSLGDMIDKKVARMQHNQTNGIPQGSVLMDFVAEIVLGYADLELSEKLIELEDSGEITDYEIIRYRDDYRIFSNDRDELELITKILSEVLYDLNFKMNSSKTTLTEDIVTDSIKPAKLYWEQISASFKHFGKDEEGNRTVTYSISLQKHLWEIKKLGNKFPNCGMLKKALSNFHKNRVYPLGKTPRDILPIIGILVDIMTRNPISVPQCILIIATLLSQIADNEKTFEIVDSILKKYHSKPNIEYLLIWLQRLTLLFGSYSFGVEETELAAKIESPNSFTMFSDDWLETEHQGEFTEGTLINQENSEKMEKAIQVSEIEDFYDYPM